MRRSSNSMLLAAGLAWLTAAPSWAPQLGSSASAEEKKSSSGSKDKAGKDKVSKEEQKKKALGRQLALAQYALFTEHDPKAAIVELKKALAMDPQNWDVTVQLVEVMTNAGDAKGALAILDKWVKKPSPSKDPKQQAQVFHAIGAVKFKSNDEKGGLEACKKAIELDPTDSQAQFQVFKDAYLKWKAGDETQKEAAVASGRGFLRANFFSRGPNYLAVQRAVLEMSGTALDLKVFDGKLAYEQAFAETGVGRINALMNEARKGFEACTTAQPDNQPCHYYLGLVYASVKASESYSLDKAMGEFGKAPDVAEANIEMGVILRHKDENAAAERSFKKALEIDGRSTRAMLELGILAKLDGRTDDAIEKFAQAYRTDPRSASGARALDELTKLNPDHELAKMGAMFGPAPQDIFSSERYLAAVNLIEQKFGGVEEKAPETAALREIVGKLLKAAGQSPSRMPRVAVLGTKDIVNAMALPNGNVYVTRALIEDFKKKWPDMPMDANNSVIAHVLAHELAHVTRQHAAQSLLYVEAVRDASARLDPSILTHTTRLQEIEADRIGMITAFLAGFGPRGGIDFLTAEGKETEIPEHLDHPSFDERVHYLEEYWSNDVKYAFQAFKSGVSKVDQAEKLESSDIGKALALYKDAGDDFKRFRETVQGGPEVLNNMGVAFAHMGVLAQGRVGGALNTWATPFSLERQTAIKYKGIDPKGASRGGDNDVPWQLVQAVELFKEAVSKDPGYRRAALNLATAQIATGATSDALAGLAKLSGGTGSEAAEVQNLVGVANAVAGKNKEAESAFKDAIKADGTQQAAMFNLGHFYQVTSRKSDADAAYKSFLAKYPSGPWSDAAKKEMGPAK